MTDFYVSRIEPMKRARIHRGSCRDCNDGRGQEGQHKTGSGNTGWSTAMTFAEAENVIAHYRMRGWTDIGNCGHCLRSGPK